MDNYRRLAEFYDEMKSMSEIKQLFFQRLFDEYTDPMILDCACGTGYDISTFSDLGYRVVGSDLSESMISVALRRDNLRKDQLHVVNFEQLDAYYNQKFDCILCLSNSINEIHVDPVKALNSMKSVLQDDGCIVFDQGQTDFSMQNPPTKEVIVDNEHVRREFCMEYTNDIMTVHIRDEIKGKFQELIVSKIQIRIRLLEDWISILHECGLAYEIYGDFDRTPYDVSESKRLIVVAKKKRYSSSY
ncbi:class I SAM-dependent methyltransferase [Candidatus Xianfuyuplasma coldseepsis]|uniref:Class I SAM-dependent methyltransferase n=1 Tax=Candidatus Xianfuyuplasma coldseepsis TaxID=2782163 RepID=A0A7L7KTV4_9MOLU|nr:class I SAM-dependent methyltransferase [Xianfuyuplasma coldseepsis]QMS85742.1 class I SAM-dependent methyltransferase [Xianfuyuplasma coldseepsis]